MPSSAGPSADIGADFKRRGPGPALPAPLRFAPVSECSLGDVGTKAVGPPKYGEEGSRGTTCGDEANAPPMRSRGEAPSAARGALTMRVTPGEGPPCSTLGVGSSIVPLE
mmetsp:Transcript_11039/g.19312  ORF Transcript_11039/g.19312 Transcript_11039/m.19312 type:complete len:110 (-) Transcript_11039:793-1122(-)